MPHILIIDDDKNNLIVLQEMLALQGISYTSLQDPLQVENILSQLDPLDAIFLDLEMPEIDGYAIFERLQSYPTLQQVPIVAYTVHTGESHHARQVGFHSFISKPLSIHKFPQQIQSILEGASVWDTK